MWSQSKSTEISHHESTIHNAYWLSRFESLLNSAPAQHRAVSLIRVDLRFPEYIPVTIMDPDPDSAVISRFLHPWKQNSGLPAEKRQCQSSVCMQPACVISGAGSLARKRQETLSRDITAQQRYTVLAEDFSVPSSLATMIQRHGAVLCILSLAG